jgi:hypothetical protein
LFGQLGLRLKVRIDGGFRESIEQLIIQLGEKVN